MEARAPRRRPRHRPRAAARRRRAPAAVRRARRLQAAAPRPVGDRDRQSAGLRVHRDLGRGLRARPVAARIERTPDRRRRADRRRAQSRKFRRPAGVHARRGGRHQHRGDRRRAGHLLRRREQHRAIRARRAHPPRPGAARLYRSDRADRSGAAPLCDRSRPRQPARRAGDGDRGDTARRPQPASKPRTSSSAWATTRSRGSTTSSACSTAARIDQTVAIKVLRFGKVIDLAIHPLERRAHARRRELNRAEFIFGGANFAHRTRSPLCSKSRRAPSSLPSCSRTLRVRGQRLHKGCIGRRRRRPLCRAPRPARCCRRLPHRTPPCGAETAAAEHGHSLGLAAAGIVCNRLELSIWTVRVRSVTKSRRLR